MSRSEAIVLYQPLLHAIAMKMVGTFEDAEDIVQDTFEKWLKIDQSKIENVRAYLIKSVSNNSLKFLSSFRMKLFMPDSHEETELAMDHKSDFNRFFNFDLESQLNEAWAVVHKKLQPVEKQVFVLREIFNVEYEELQHVIGKKSDNCRQIFSRAKSKIQDDSRALKIRQPFEQLTSKIQQAFTLGSVSALIEELRN